MWIVKSLSLGIKFYDMKKLSILLASAALLFSISIQAQITKNTQATRTNSLDKPSQMDVQEGVFLYGSMVVFQQNSREVVKISFDETVSRTVTNKEVISLTEQLSSYRYTSLVEALNVLSSHGWNVCQTWTQEGSRTGTEVHFLLRMNIKKSTPMSPWLEKRKS